MILEFTVQVHIDPKSWSQLAEIDEDEVLDDVKEYLLDCINEALEYRDQNSVLDFESKSV